MSWVPRLDPTGGMVGLRSRYLPRGTEPVIAPKPAPRAPVAEPPPAATHAPKPPPVSLRPDTHRGRILAALAHHTSGRATPVAVADLVVRAWRMSPQVFGLRGREQHHPDSNAVLSKLCGASGLVALGMVARTRPGAVSLTSQGARWWRDVGREWLAAQGGTR